MTFDAVKELGLLVLVRHYRLTVAAVTLLSTVLLALSQGAGKPDYADAKAYLSGGYHLARHGVFSESLSPEAPEPAVGREPGYGAFLAVLMSLDPGMRAFDPTCLGAEPGCSPGMFRSAQWANAAFIALSGAVAFFIVLRLSGRLFAGYVSASHIWLNMHMAKGRQYAVSDHFSLLLMVLCCGAVVWALGKRHPAAWLAPGVALAALSLTKAVFLYLVAPAVLIALVAGLLGGAKRRRFLASVVVFAIAYAVPVGGWMARNHSLEGSYSISMGRTATALNVRAVLNEMTPKQYLAAFVYWTRGMGDSLARRWFDETVWGPFDLERPDGFYLRGQLGAGSRARTLMATEGIDRAEAESRIEREVRQAILGNLAVHAATTLPIFYRGIWIDEFIVVSLPALLWLSWWAVRRRDGGMLLVLLLGIFSLTFYPLVSLNIPRYQITAIPALAIATGLAAAAIAQWLKQWLKRRRGGMRYNTS